MLIIKAQIFIKNPEVVFGFSTKLGAGRTAPYYFNLSHSVGDVKNIVDENREIFFNRLGLNSGNVALQRQVHGDEITYINEGGNCGESDAMITSKKNLGLAISTADCAAIFIYDKKQKVIAAVHSGWRGSRKRILEKTLVKLRDDFNSGPGDLLVYIAPSISKKNYEVDKEVAGLFDKKYYSPWGDKFLLDISRINYEILLDFGLNKKNIQVSSLCSYGMTNLLHSYRRDGLNSGRALGVIAIVE